MPASPRPAGLVFVGCSGNGGSDDEGPFRFDCNALEVKLSPRSRERETSNAAADATFEALLAEVRVCWQVSTRYTSSFYGLIFILYPAGRFAGSHCCLAHSEEF